ncbi:MAG: hypothetical protein JSV03_03760 [Planctomycetota bacterium]|nr:MAG: hypothetical protein JSV03_03760 [Planctomycetota bacterium]
MSKQDQTTGVLEELLDTLESAAGGKGANNQSRAKDSGDAIDAVLSSANRMTNVRSLRDSPEVAAFREALIDGLISVDTANQLLRLVNNLIVRLLA